MLTNPDPRKEEPSWQRMPRSRPKIRFAVSKAVFAALAAGLAGPAAAGLTACELEDLLDERGRE